MTAWAAAAPMRQADPGLFARVMDTERAYFELGARLEDLHGAVLAWTPGFVSTPGAAVVHRVEPDVFCHQAPTWIGQMEKALVLHGIGLARVYLDTRHEGLEGMLRDAGYACREELLFADRRLDPPTTVDCRPIVTEADWRRKLAFHEAVQESPDGHANLAADIVGLERHKCAHGMEAFSGEMDGRMVAVVGAVWGERVVRIKNLLVHPEYRRRSIATALLDHIAAIGRQRGIEEQCLVALKGGTGEIAYRSLGMTLVGSCFEWSKPVTRR